uniref:Uncharacterized protein n=1 Tax=Rhizophora mucronata TaxID=61149 RepID=A0A2P2P647_RHIMU
MQISISWSTRTVASSPARRDQKGKNNNVKEHYTQKFKLTTGTGEERKN